MPRNNNMYSLNVDFDDMCEAEDNYPELGIVKGFWHVKCEATVAGPDPQEAEEIESFDEFVVTLCGPDGTEVYEFDLIKATDCNLKVLRGWAECLITSRQVGKRNISLSDSLMEDANDERMVWENDFED